MVEVAMPAMVMTVRASTLWLRLANHSEANPSASASAASSPICASAYRGLLTSAMLSPIFIGRVLPLAAQRASEPRAAPCKPGRDQADIPETPVESAAGVVDTVEAVSNYFHSPS